MDKFNNIYMCILKSKLGIALLSIIPFFFMKKMLLSELYELMLVVTIATIATSKKFSKKESILFALLYSFLFLCLEIGYVVKGLVTSPFGMVTLIYYGASMLIALAIKFLIWLIAGGFIFYLFNLVLTVLMRWEKTELIFKPFTKLLSNPLKMIFTSLLIGFVINLFLYSTSVHIKVDFLPELEKSKLKIEEVLNEKRILLYSAKENKLALYDIEKDFLIKDCPELKPIPDGYVKDHEYTLFDKLKNGDVFIRNCMQSKSRENMSLKTYAYIYSPKKNAIVWQAELPKEISFYQAAIIDIDAERIFVVGADSDKKTYIYNIKDKSIEQKSETIEERRGCEIIKLKNGKLLIWGGYSSNDSIELYDINKDVFEKIPLGFKQKFVYGNDKLYLLEDGRVVIKTTKMEDKKENGVGEYSSSIYSGTGYPVPCVVLYNPNDNSFKEIDINKNSKYRHDNKVSIASTADGKIIIAGGSLISKKRIKLSGYDDKINFYNVKTNKLQKSYGMKFDDTLSPYIYTLNNNEFIYVYGTDFGIDHKQRYHKLKI